jgi:SAM-dependent methyltransferase/uncharacterized protein YbaR (Trm112 family)
VDPWLLAKLACPYDSSPLVQVGDGLKCSQLHSFEIVDGIPILLREDTPRTHPGIQKTISEVAEHRTDELKLDVRPDEIDPVVQVIVSATCGRLYEPLIGKLKRYPIPRIRLPEGDGRALLDIGCNWGRWTFAAARKGYRAVGIDPDLGPLLAAKRIALQLGLYPHFVVGDARRLPFLAESFDSVFSYSVIQHFSKDDARQTFWEIGRVLCNGGHASVQMPNSHSLLGVYRSLRHRRPVAFDVRNWSPSELRSMARQLIGSGRLSVDGFFGLGIQPDDVDLLPLRYRVIVKASELLRSASTQVRPLVRVADSVYVDAIKSESVHVRHQLLALFQRKGQKDRKLGGRIVA